MLIGLCGRPDSGQDLITNYLACGSRAFHVITFDAPLRHMIQACAGIHETYFSLARLHDVIPALGKSPAQLLHTLREAWIRAPMDPDVLVRHFAQRWPGTTAGMLWSPMCSHKQRLSSYRRALGG